MIKGINIIASKIDGNGNQHFLFDKDGVTEMWFAVDWKKKQTLVFDGNNFCIDEVRDALDQYECEMYYERKKTND